MKDPRLNLHAAFGLALQRQDWNAALESGKALLDLLPPDAVLRYNLGLVLKRLGRGGDSIVHFETALMIDPAYANARFELAATLMDEGEIERAAQLFARYLEQVPGDGDALLNLGNILVRLNRPREALAPLRAAHQISQLPQVVASLAAAERDVGNLDAWNALLEAIPQTPEGAALRLKIRTQGSTGRLSLAAPQATPDL